MIWLLAGLALAAEPETTWLDEPVSQPAVEAPVFKPLPVADERRLLGEGPAGPPSATDLPGGSQVPWILLGLLGIGGAFAATRWLQSRTVDGPQPALTVVQRTSLGGQAGLALIEVRTDSDLPRRLLVGFGSGPVQLVADLDLPTVAEPVASFAELAPPRPSQRIETRDEELARTELAQPQSNRPDPSAPLATRQPSRKGRRVPPDLTREDLQHDGPRRAPVRAYASQARKRRGGAAALVRQTPADVDEAQSLVASVLAGRKS